MQNMIKYSDEELKTLYEQKLTDGQIADIMGVHKSTICARRKVLGLKTHHRCKLTKFTDEEFIVFYEQELNDVEIAKILKVSVSAVCKRRLSLSLPCYKKPLLPVPKDFHTVCAKYNVKRGKISKHYGVSIYVVTRWLTELYNDIGE